MNTTHFLSKLNWAGSGEIFIPVFSKEEIDNTPLKWLKHLFLVEIGLRDYQELINEIKRFKMDKQGIWQTYQACEELLNSVTKEGEYLLIIKVVFPEITIGLPNYRINYANQLDAVFSDIRKNFLHTAKELWICLSDISYHGSNFGGRLAIKLDKTYTPEILEIIWYASPRILDGYQVTDYPYVKSSKYPDSMIFKMEHLQKPERYNDDKGLEIRMMRDYRFALYELYSRKERIAEMCEMLSENGVDELVLQFKVNNGRFTIIDWDTNSITSMKT